MSDLWVGVIGSLIGACVGGSIAAAVTRYQVQKSSAAQRALLVEGVAMNAARDLQSALHSALGSFLAFSLDTAGTATYLARVEGCLNAEAGLLSPAHKHVWINAHLLGPNLVGRFYEIFERYQEWEQLARVALVGERDQLLSGDAADSLAENLRERMRRIAELTRRFAILNVTPNPYGDLAASLAIWDRPERS